MQRIMLALCLVLSACGGTSETAPAPVQNVPVPVVTQPIVFIGDSITALWTLPIDAVNAGIAGQTSDEMLARYQTDVLDKHPRIVVILAGTNDLRHIANPTTANIARMAELASHAGAKVVLCSIPPINDWAAGMPLDATAGNQAVHDWNRELLNTARAFGYAFADYYPTLVNADDTQNVALFKPDRLHPNAAGYAVMWPVISALLHGS